MHKNNRLIKSSTKILKSKYHLKKKEKEIKKQDEIFEILKRGRYAVISMCRANEPYIVTMNYGFDENQKCLYFHCAKQGLKTDFIRNNPSVCCSVIEDRGYCHGKCDHSYRSVVFLGIMYEVENIKEKKHGLDVLLNHLEKNPDPIKKKILKDKTCYEGVNILRLDIKEITGKKNIVP